jgi:lipid II:glycine glycyltransferase (peptidoglycan interpeptide bridge formation enzyme)
MPEVSAAGWEQWLAQFPDVHILQTANWGALKESFGWEPVRVVAESPGVGPIGAQILFRKLPLGLLMGYLAKGPVGAQEELQPESPAWIDLWREVDAICRTRRAVFLKLEPDLWRVESVEQPPPPGGFRPAAHSIQPLRTILLDLTASEDQLLARMKQKTRYNIRLAQKRGVLVHPSSDLDTFYRLITATGDRDAFGVHSQDYYTRAYELFQPYSQCELLMAVYEEKPLAALLVFNHGKRAWYFYGASGDEHRELMPTYLLQWEAMRWARSQGCSQYDLWGVPDVGEDILEANFTERSDNLWGVYRFKRGFGGQVQRARGPWDRVYRPFWYRLYRTYIQFRGGGEA